METYFLPMLTTKEIELVEQKNYSYLKTFMGSIPDVDEAEMRLSESNSKFVYAFGHRRTFIISNWWYEKPLTYPSPRFTPPSSLSVQDDALKLNLKLGI